VIKLTGKRFWLAFVGGCVAHWLGATVVRAGVLLHDTSFASGWAMAPIPFASFTPRATPDPHLEIQHRHGGQFPQCAASDHWSAVATPSFLLRGTPLRVSFRARAFFEGSGAAVPAVTINPYYRKSDGAFGISFSGPSVTASPGAPGAWTAYRSEGIDFGIPSDLENVYFGFAVTSCGFGGAEQAFVVVEIDDFVVETSNAAGTTIRLGQGSTVTPTNLGPLPTRFEESDKTVTSTFRVLISPPPTEDVSCTLGGQPVLLLPGLSDESVRFSFPEGNRAVLLRLADVRGDASIGQPAATILLIGKSDQCTIEVLTTWRSQLNAQGVIVQGGINQRSGHGSPAPPAPAEAFDDASTLSTLRAFRDRILSTSDTGRAYAALYRELSGDLIRAVGAKPSLLGDFFTLRDLWLPGVEALVSGRGATVRVSGEMAAHLNALLDELAGAGSPALRKAIASERRKLGLDRITGMSFEEFRAATLERATFRSTGGRVFFAASAALSGRELWSTDGTPQGTRLEFDACPGTCSGAPVLFDVAPGATGQLFFAATESGGPQSLFRLRSPAAPELLAARAFAQSGPVRAAIDPANGSAHFFSSSEAQGPWVDLWRTDGTVAGTRKLTSSSVAAARSPLAALAGIAYFSGGPESERALWRIDGQPGGTYLLRRGVEALLGDPRRLLTAGAPARRVVGAGVDPSGVWRLASSEGSDASSQSLGKIHGEGGLDWASLARAGARVVVAGRKHDASEDVLWATQGTAATTEVLRKFGRDAVGADTALVELGSRVIFAAADSSGREPWTTDGTVRGTKLLVDGCAGPCSSEPGVVATWGTRALVRTRDASGKIVLHATDGVAVATPGVLCKADCSGLQIVVLDDGDRALLLVDRPTTKVEVWSTQGRAGDLKRLRELPLESLPTAGWAFLAQRDALVFAGADAAGSPDLVPFAISLTTGSRVRLGDARP
jgi:ELWxxDGT repeat protein